MSGGLLVVAHEATRTGSPKVLLDLLRYAVPRIEVPVGVELLAGGPLAEQLRETATTRDHIARPDAVLVNGALAAGELERFDEGIAAAVYVHEQGEALAVLSGSARRCVVERADRILCVSERARSDLVGLGADDDRIVVLPPVVSLDGLPTADEVEAARRMVGGRDDEPLVIGCGEAGWRKGTDLFLQVSSRLHRRLPARFAWVGRRRRAFGRVLDHDTNALGLADRMTWWDEVPNPAPFLAAADLLVMTSREDPQPLVPLEAALVGTPTVAFARDGLADFADEGVVEVAPYPDVVALAEVAVEGLARPTWGPDLARRGAELVARRRSLDIVGERFVAELARLVA